MDSGSGGTHLAWQNVGIGFSFILIDAFLSIVLGLQVGSSLIVASVRCVLQLSVMGLVLRSVFDAETPWAVAGVSFLLMCLGTLEAVVNRSKLRFQHMVPSVFVALVLSTIPVSIIGTRYAMSESPFWIPKTFIPIVGMLAGNTVSGVVVAVGYALRELKENKDKIEVYLSFGASRFEACRPIMVESLRLALTPTINQMSVIGLISIPGMMTGSILGGSSVEQAAKLQMVIMFMISSASALAAMVCTILALSISVDGDVRVRTDRIISDKHAIWKARDAAGGYVLHLGQRVAGGMTRLFTRHRKADEGMSEDR